MIFCLKRLPDFLCGEAVYFSVWRDCVIFCVEKLRDFLCGDVA